MENELQVLLANLMISKSNVQLIHWNLYGNEFQSAHSDITNEMYNKIDDDIDRVAEMCTRLNIRVLNYFDVIKVIKENEDFKPIVISSDQMFNKDECYTKLDSIYRSILKTIENAWESDDIKDNISNIGIRSDLESMHNEYDIQYRFINKRKIKNNDVF